MNLLVLWATTGVTVPLSWHWEPGPTLEPCPSNSGILMVCPWAAGLPATPHVLLAVFLAISSLSYDRRQTLSTESSTFLEDRSLNPMPGSVESAVG